MSVPPMIDRRQAVRYPLAIPVEVAGEKGVTYRAVTRDISASGVLLHTEHRPSLGEALRLSFTFEGQDIQLHCEGIVIRIEERPLGIGVGIHFDLSRSDTMPFSSRDQGPPI